MEELPISQDVRRQLGLPENFVGAMVRELLPGGPASTAGLRSGDLVVKVGNHEIRNVYDLEEETDNRIGPSDCAPVTVGLLRGKSVVEVKLTPVDRWQFAAQACEKGGPRACFLKAWLEWPGDYEDQDEVEDQDDALLLFDAACQAGSARACDYEGHHLMDEGEDADQGRAAHLLRRACRLGDPTGCVDMGYAFSTGDGVEWSQSRATPFYEKACALGDGLGCYNVGCNYDKACGVKHDLARSVAAYKNGCRDGSSSACTNLGLLYESGRGVPRDLGHAVELYEKGCEGTRGQESQTHACVQLGLSYRDGIGIASDHEHARSIFKTACDRTERTSQDIYGNRHRARACALLGAMYRDGDGGEKDTSSALASSEWSCQNGDAMGCLIAAKINAAGGEGVPADRRKAVELYELACDNAEPQGCNLAGAAYRDGIDVDRDEKRAETLLTEGRALSIAKERGVDCEW